MMILDPPSLSVSQHENGEKVKAHLKKTMFFAWYPPASERQWKLAQVKKVKIKDTGYDA